MRWVFGTIVALVAVTATAFTIQNSTFEAALQLDLGFAAWKLSQPVSVPVLMWSSFGVGLLLGGIGMAIRGRRTPRYDSAPTSAAAAAAKDPWAGA